MSPMIVANEDNQQLCIPYIMFPSVNIFPQLRANFLEGDGRRTHGLDDSIRGRCSSYSLCVTKDFREEADISVQPLHSGKTTHKDASVCANGF